MNVARVLIADNHPLLLVGVRTLLDASCNVVGEVTDGPALVEAALHLRPDLTILGIDLPVLNGIEAARQIKARWPQARLLFLTRHSDVGYLREAMRAGANGYVLKTSSLDEVRKGIDTVLRGGTCIASAFAPDVLDELRVGGKLPDPPVRLSQRQREILQLITEGQSNKEIATILKISVKTVEFHRGRIMQKLQVHSAAELTASAVRNDLVVESRPHGGGGPALDRLALEGLWRKRVDTAQLRCNLANLQVKEVHKKFEGLTSADGDLLLRNAVLLENRALGEYNRVLRIYNDLTVHGKRPEEM